MARCSNEELLKKIGYKKIDKNVEVVFDVQRDLPDCRKINTKDFISISGDYTYNKYRKPENRFECMREGCINSGLLMLAEANETVEYHLAKDATEYGAGAVTLYVYPDDAELPVTVTLTIGDAEDLANADIYEVEVTEDMVTADGFAPVIIDLAKTPTSVAGEGWTPSASGSYIQLSADKAVGLSSVAIFDSIEDFEIADVVRVGCISSMGGSFDIDTIESTCLSSGYSDDLSSLSFPVTGNMVTPNYHLLNPLNGKGGETDGFVIESVRKTIESVTIDEKTYGQIVLADAAQNECGYIDIQIADSCNVADATLKRLSIPTVVDVDEGHYQVIENADGTTSIIFNDELIGKEILISYPQAAQVEEWVGNVDNLGSVRTRMTVTLETTDGNKEVHVFNNVLVTGFPMSFTTEETEFAFTITIQKDAGGDFYHIYKIAA